MRGSIRQSAWRIPEGAHHRALKAEAEVVEGSINDLLWDLAIYRHAMQRVVDALWDLDRVPSRSQAHRMFYSILRSYGFRAHVARNIYECALALVKAVKESDGGKPTLRKLSARLDYQDARVKLDRGVVRIILRDKWYALKLKHRREYIERFKNLRWKEVHVKYENGKIYVSIVFEFVYKPYVPRGIIALDTNLRMITAYDGSEVRRHRARFVDALSKRRRAEELQKKYPKRWRYNEKILSRIKALHRKAKNITVDWSWKLAKQIALKALRRGYAVALENLEGLREKVNSRCDEVTWKFTMFAYRRLQQSVISKAIEYGVTVVVVDPRNTSSTCPRCGEKLVYIYRLAVCRRCGFKADRDSVGAVNIWLRALQAYAGVPGSPLSTPAVKDETRQSG
ncbi:MAG: RNA-guided endonuclease TnpB family protein, partial [Desulfurococcaceae archaeon]